MRFLAIFSIMAACGVTQAQTTSSGDLQVHGSFRTRLEMWDWFDARANDGSYTFSGNILRLSLSRQAKNVDWQLEFAAPFLLGLPDDAVAAGATGQLGLGATYYVANSRSQNAGMVFAKQGFVRFKNLFGDAGQSLRLGRFEFSDGVEVMPKDATLAWVKRERIGQRLLGPFGWSHVGRSFDGLQYSMTRGRNNLTLLAVKPTRGAFQVDGWGELDVAVGYAALTHSVQTNRTAGDYRAFAMYVHDWRSVVKTDNRPLASRQRDFSNIRIGTFGGHAADTINTRAGTIDTLAWGLLQTGKWGNLDHRAGAFLLEGGWQPAVLPKLKPWLRGGYSYTSGDGDPGDNRHSTFFQALPTPRPYARMPFFNMMNNQDAFGMLIIRPHRMLTLRAEAHGLRLAERNDLWYLGGGAFQPWTFGYVGRSSNGARGLATLYDVSADLNPGAHWSITGYYGKAIGHSVVRNIYPEGKDGQFGYIEVVYRF
jgi:hypothetical protein